MLADVSRYILGRTEGRGLGFGQLVRTHKGKCLKCQSSSDGHSDHNALCAGGRQGSAGPAPVSKLGQGVPDIHRCLASGLHCTESREVSWPLCRCKSLCFIVSCQSHILCLRSLTADFCKSLCFIVSCQSHMSRHPLEGY